MWSDREKRIQKIDRLARSLLIQGLLNDIYSLVDSNKTAKDLWDALVGHKLGSEYGEQDRKAAVLYEYETFKATEGELMINSIQNGDQPLPVIAQVSLAGNAQNTPPILKDPKKAIILYEYETFKANEGEQLLDTYLCYLQAINDLKKCGYKKDNCESSCTICNQNGNRDVNDALGCKKKALVVTSDPLALVAEKTNVSKRKEKIVVSSDSEGIGADDFSELKKIIALLAKALNRRKFYSKPTNNNLRTSSTSQSANKKQEFVKSDDKKEDKKADEKKKDMSKIKCYNCKKEGHFAKDCKKAKEINANMVFMAQIENVLSELDESSSSAEETIAEIADQEVLFDKMSVELVELDKHVRDLKNTVLEKDFKNSELEECVCNKYLEIEKCLARLNVCENKLHKIGQINQTVHMIMPSKDNLYNGRKGIGFENPSYFEKAKDLRPTLYDEKVIGLGYTPTFLTHSDEALEIEKFKRSRENKIEFAYDYRNLNASYVNEKINFEDDYFQEIINPDFKKIDSPFQQTISLKPYVPNVILEKIIIDLEDEVVSLLEKEKENLKTIESLKSNGFESSENVISESENQSENTCHVVEKECDKVENPKVIAPGMFKLSVSQSVSPISMSKTSCKSNNVESKLKRKRRKRKSSKQNDKQVNIVVSRANSDFVHFLDLDTFSSVRRPKNSGVIWKKKGSSNTSNVDLSAVSLSKLNKNVKRYSHKDLLSCNNSHLGETISAYVCNDVMNVSCDSRMYDLLDENNFLIFDDESELVLKIQVILKVIGLGYTPMFLTHSDEALEIEKFKRSRENKIEFANDYGNVNASYVNQTSSLKPYVPNVILEKIIIYLEDKVVSLLEKEKANLKTIESLKSKGFESSENAISESENQSENDCHVVEKECDQVENSKVIAPGMFKLSVSQSVSPISMLKTSCDSKNVEIFQN
nr:hypothetical protein [Tanacetum cinerariifolium]